MNQASSALVVAYCLERVFGPWPRKGESRWSLVDSLNGGDKLSIQGDEGSRVLKSEQQREKCCTERESWRSPGGVGGLRYSENPD